MAQNKGRKRAGDQVTGHQDTLMDGDHFYAAYSSQFHDWSQRLEGGLGARPSPFANLPGFGAITYISSEHQPA